MFPTLPRPATPTTIDPNVLAHFTSPSNPLSDRNAATLPFISTAGESGDQAARDQAINDQTATALGASPAISALRQALDAQRISRVQDQQDQLTDAENPDIAQTALDRARLGNQIGDVNSEAAAMRQFLPNAQAAAGQLARSQAAAAQLKADLENRNTLARVGAEGANDIASIQAKSGAGSIEGFRQALRDIVAKKGALPSPADIAALKAQYIQPQQP